MAASEVESKIGGGNVAAAVGSFVILISVGWGAELLLCCPS